jgi:hypothetical protein
MIRERRRGIILHLKINRILTSSRRVISKSLDLGLTQGRKLNRRKKALMITTTTL